MAILNGITFKETGETHQLDYNKAIAKKPFYSEQGEVDILPKADYEFTKEEYDNLYSYYPTYVLEPNTNYIVEWDNVTYNLTSIEADGGYMMGNFSLLGAGEDTGEPFIIGYAEGVLSIIMTADTSTSHNIRIYQIDEVVHQIDPKYVDGYTKAQINEMLGVYVDEVNTLLGGDE